MPQSHARLIGTRVPAVRLGELVEGQLRAVRASDIFGRGASVIVGMPGAFTPLCSEKHLPNLISNADRLRASGFREIACVATSDPYSVEAWARAADPGRKVRFLSDGNLSLVRSLGLTTHATRHFLGECSERYMLTVRDGVIASVRVEDEITDFSCTRSDDLVLEEV
jgi:peroxiredoxin